MQRGTKHTEESKAKMSARARSRPPASAETRAKNSRGVKAAWAARRQKEQEAFWQEIGEGFANRMSQRTLMRILSQGLANSEGGEHD